jgi:hypothetical protein
MAQTVTVKDFKIGDFKDQNGNTWCEVEFEEFPGKQIKWVVKDPTKVRMGDKVYGHTEQKTSKANKPYLRFVRDQNPDKPVGGSSGGTRGNYQPKDEHAIAKAVALKASVDFHASAAKKDTNTVLADADMFLTWLETEKDADVKMPLDTSPDPMDAVHSNNPMNEPVYSGESVDLSDIPF